MVIEPNYSGFSKFFLNNRIGAEKEFNDLHMYFKSAFDESLKIGVGTDFESHQKGTAAALYLRAAKYLYTAHELSIVGHTEESRILLRNAIELLILGFLISKEQEVYSLWIECYELRLKYTDRDGNINLEPIRKARYKVSQIRDKYLSTLEASNEAAHLYGNWKEFSERYSHENMFNIAVRVESNEDETGIYVGDGHDSQTRRMAKTMHLTLEILQDLISLMKGLSN